ncbi:MAG: hypothetical protein ACHQ4G_04135 [Opitutales bacterium]
MKDRRLPQLFAAARGSPPAEVPADFSARVMAAVRAQPVRPVASAWDEVDRLFPWLAATAVLVMALCLAVDYSHAAMAGPDLADGAVQLLEQWLLA